jgi:hypothetical protein
MDDIDVNQVIKIPGRIFYKIAVIGINQIDVLKGLQRLFDLFVNAFVFARMNVAFENVNARHIIEIIRKRGDGKSVFHAELEARFGFDFAEFDNVPNDRFQPFPGCFLMQQSFRVFKNCRSISFFSINQLIVNFFIISVIVNSL